MGVVKLSGGGVLKADISVGNSSPKNSPRWMSSDSARARAKM